MDILQLMHSKKFYGQEFLTWLWYKSETQTGKLTENIELWIDDMISLESGETEQPEKVTLKGGKSGLSEAKHALRNGKKVIEAKIVLIMGDQEWNFVTDSMRLSFRSMKTSANNNLPKEQEDEAGYFFDQITNIERAVKAMDELFEMFMQKRLDQEAWNSELKNILAWVISETSTEEKAMEAVVN